MLRATARLNDRNAAKNARSNGKNRKAANLVCRVHVLTDSNMECTDVPVDRQHWKFGALMIAFRCYQINHPATDHFNPNDVASRSTSSTASTLCETT